MGLLIQTSEEYCQEERELPDLVYVCIIAVISLTALITHLPSLCSILRTFSKPNNASLIYRNLFLVDVNFLIVYCPMDVFWSLARSSGTIFREGSQSHLRILRRYLLLLL